MTDARWRRCQLDGEDAPRRQKSNEGQGSSARGGASGDYTETRTSSTDAPTFHAVPSRGTPTGSVAWTINQFLTTASHLGAGGFGANGGTCVRTSSICARKVAQANN